MKEEQRLAEIIKYMNDTQSDVNGFNKTALLKTAAAYFENRTAAEASAETFKQIYSRIGGL